MPIISISNGATSVDLTNDDPEIYYSFVQTVYQDDLGGSSMTNPIDARTFKIQVNISATILDVSKFSDLQTIRNAQTAPATTTTLYWNSAEVNKPAIDGVNATGYMEVIIGSITLEQKKGTPANEYDLVLILYGRVYS